MANKGDKDDLEYLNKYEMSRRDFMLDFLAAGGMMAAGMMRPEKLLAAEKSADDEVVRIGYLPITDATALLVAHAKGYFEDEGLKSERPTMIRGWSPLVESFAAGKVNLVHMLNPIPVWMRYNNHFPVKILSWAHVNGSGVIVGEHTGATSFKDMGGMQVAVPFWYSSHNIILQMALRHVGLKPVIKSTSEKLAPDEVNLQVMPPPEMPPALASQKLDAYIVAEPFNAAGELLAHGKMLRFTGDIWKNHPCCVVCMNEKVVEAKPAWTQKVINAIVRAEGYTQEHKEEVAVMLSRDGKGYLPMPAKVVVRAMTDYKPSDYRHPDAIEHPNWGVGRIDFSPYPYPSATKLIVDFMNKTLVSGNTTFLNKLEPSFVAKDLVNYDFVKKAMAKYTGWEKAPGVNPKNPFEREEVISI